MNDNLSLVKEIKDLGVLQGKYKPHKHIALLAAIRILKAKPENGCRVYYDSDFKQSFTKIFLKYAGINDRDRPYNPFFHLKSTSFWELIPLKGKETTLLSLSRISGPSQLMEVVSHAEVNDDFMKLILDNNTSINIESLITECLENRIIDLEDEDTKPIESFERIKVALEHNVAPNPFVAYLNSLHSRDAGNENALAEAQACNPNFSKIYVRHPLVDTILQCLTGEMGQSVVLTGHAGDGKSTIALTVYKHLKNIDEQSVLPFPLGRREDITLPNGHCLAIIKDFSEWKTIERDDLIAEVMAKKVRALFVSNTGVLLDALCGYAERTNLGNRSDWEPRILEAMDAESSDFQFDAANFAFLNIALTDNLSLARLIFDRILSDENWKACDRQSCRSQCPIYRNVELFRVNSFLAKHRLFLAYRRMYEYGTRLTIRQLTAHLAYLLTAGMEYADIQNFARRDDKHLMSEFLFYNRFFGDNGHTEDLAAVRMPVIREVRAQGFGQRPCPATERHLWLLTHGDDFTLGVSLLEEEFGKLRRYGSQMKEQENGLTPDQAREQVRRMLYFLYKSDNAGRNDAFLQQFLGSLAIIKWEQWQTPDARLSMDESSHFKQRVFHVLQEQFTGVRLPEVGGPGQQSHLYITLSRHKQDIRQSAQVVLAQIDFSNEFKITLSLSKQRRDLVLVGQGRLDGINLTLTLPFLDYVLARHQGEVGETLQGAYADRLERLKADIIRRCRNREDDEMLLVRLRTNHTFLRQHFAIEDGKLEVSNA